MNCTRKQRDTLIKDDQIIDYLFENSSYVCDIGRKNGNDRDILKFFPKELEYEIPQNILCSIVNRMNLKYGKENKNDVFFVPESFISWAKIRLIPPDGERGYLISSIHKACCNKLNMTNFSLGVWNLERTELITKNPDTWFNDIVKYYYKKDVVCDQFLTFDQICKSRILAMQEYKKIFDVCKINKNNFEDMCKYHDFLVDKSARTKKEDKHIPNNAKKVFHEYFGET